jgi:hypothetical protein
VEIEAQDAKKRRIGADPLESDGEGKRGANGPPLRRPHVIMKRRLTQRSGRESMAPTRLKLGGAGERGFRKQSSDEHAGVG